MHLIMQLSFFFVLRITAPAFPFEGKAGADRRLIRCLFSELPIRWFCVCYLIRLATIGTFPIEGEAFFLAVFSVLPVVGGGTSRLCLGSAIVEGYGKGAVAADRYRIRIQINFLLLGSLVDSFDNAVKIQQIGYLKRLLCRAGA